MSIFGRNYQDTQSQWGDTLRVEGTVVITANAHSPFVNARGDVLSGSHVGPTVLRWGPSSAVGVEQVSDGLFHIVSSGQSGNVIMADVGEPYVPMTGSFTGSGGKELVDAKAAMKDTAGYRVYPLGTATSASSPFLANTPGPVSILAFAVAKSTPALSGAVPVPVTPTADITVPFWMVYSSTKVTSSTPGG